MFRILYFLGLIALVFGVDWQGFVDNQLIERLDQGAIIGLDGSVLAISSRFALEDGEGAALASLFEEPSDALAKGITIGGIRYLTTRADDRSIHGRKGATGIVTAKTEQAIIIGVSHSPGTAASTVEKLANYLREIGY